MAKDINNCTFVGRATRDPQVFTSRAGKTVCKFSLAINGWKENDVSFFDFVMFDTFAEKVGKYITKGKRLAIVAEAKQNTWTDDETGNNRSRVEFIVKDLNLLDGGKDNAKQTEDMFRIDDSSSGFEDDIAF